MRPVSTPTTREGSTSPLPTSRSMYDCALGMRPGGRRRRVRIATLRLVREGSFPAPDGYPAPGTPVRSPRDVYQLMAPYAAREVGESFWILALDSQHRLAGGAPTVITRG